MNSKIRNNSFLFIFLIIFCSFLFSQDGFFNSGGNRPYVDAGEDIEVTPGSIIYLDGTESYLGDGSKVQYNWILAPGLALNKDNSFSSEDKIETYDAIYLKSIQTYEDVLEIQVADNDTGVKLEVYLNIKDRLGFTASDTLIVEYLFSTDLDTPLVLDSLISSDSLFTTISDSDSTLISKVKVDSTQNQKSMFYQGISFLEKMRFKDEKWFTYVKYPFIAGGAYFFIDKLFLNNIDEQKLEKPPGFPHDS